MSLITLPKELKARHPDSGKPITLVGVDLSSVFGPKLVALSRGPNGIYAELLEYADEEPL